MQFQRSMTQARLRIRPPRGGRPGPTVRRAVNRRTQPSPEPATRRGWLAELEAEALLLSDLQTSPSEAQCAHLGIPTHRGVCAARAGFSAAGAARAVIINLSNEKRNEHVALSDALIGLEKEASRRLP
jgi:hypothetical protein